MKQQIVISGVGGQGVLFVTRLLAEAAIVKGISVFTSETHGMAQRGGTVLSHLKVGNFSSPLIRPGNANGLLALKADGFARHGYFLKPGAWAAVNRREKVRVGPEFSAYTVDAEILAQRIHNPKSVNLILLGFALAAISETLENRLFCSLEDIKMVLQHRLAKKKQMLDNAVKAVETGFNGFQK
ncbi:MAG: 2-oxoacid:acceptor oxidoreductase family protein [Deltaproteobacteria bacterium]|nr:2-oxoacid:acceptor oxidoreductase family protein [Deltaproteobacteria bacterium]